MGGECSSNARYQKYVLSVGIPEEKRPLQWVVRRKWEDNVRLKNNEKKMWVWIICLKIRPTENTTINLRVPKQEDNFFRI
jgi:hypothetical protein